ncbi:ECF transporter S component [Dellaglioa sp. BT-FLS60]
MRNERLRKIILAGLFAAIIYIGISVFRIPIPAMVGKPFIHFGNSLAALAVIFLGFSYGTIAGAIGLGLFDVLNGYADTSYFTVLEVIAIALLVTGMMKLLKNYQGKYWIIIVAATAGIGKIGTSYLVSIGEAMIKGVSLKVAIVQAFLSLPATVVNSISTIIIVSLLYVPIKKLMARFNR